MTSWLPPNDLEISHAQKGEKKALGEVLTKCSPYIFSVCSPWCRPPIEASDVTQEALIRVADHIDSYKHSSAFFSWVYTIAYRTFIDASRKNARRQSIAPTMALNDDIDVAQQDDSSHASEIYEALEKMEGPAREILILIDVQELSYSEAAAALAIPVGTVRSRLARARLALKKILLDQGTYPSTHDVLESEE